MGSKARVGWHQQRPRDVKGASVTSGETGVMAAGTKFWSLSADVSSKKMTDFCVEERPAWWHAFHIVQEGSVLLVYSVRLAGQRNYPPGSGMYSPRQHMALGVGK